MKRVLILCAGLGLAACTEEVVDGRVVYQDQCAGCHGVDAKGNGELSAGLETSPPDLTRIAFRNGGVFDTNAVMSQIDGMHRADGSPMPEFGAGDMGTVVMVDRTPVPAELLVLAGYLATLQE